MPKKFELSKQYLNKYELSGGFVRYDSASDELCIARNNYNDDVNTSDWEILSDVIEEAK